ncbi:antitoxin [Streptomyces sp. JJ36]|uniref:antitoxin n=1 Tax=Streptomyces sp. JJ36 TaxID=2736645 RepID=UPI001F2833B3|nr:antitoxin [Streptomyces sp. JJ36]MCF6523922.1 antitoxin [Streptomyces sp. JJ36]
MGFMDKVKGMLGQHGDKVERGVDKTAETVDRKTGGKYTDKIERGTGKAKESMDRMSEDRRRDEGGGQGGPAA